ncbi:MAG: tRNA 2-thiouridine(34) synthase MnmA, partial [Spirochaetia bacterium]|nr:tRNA 2-thiouridine(34) synthase MnmA [Spirochaetia bacterium]
NSGIHPCTAELRADGTVQVLLKEKTVITPGQSAVFYDGDIVLGGGIIV